MFKVTLIGVDNLKKKLGVLFKDGIDIVLRSATEYLIGDDQASGYSHGLKHEPGYKYVNRYAGFPGLGYTNKAGDFVPGWASAKQHGYVLAQIRSGRITPGQDSMTHALQEGWNYKKVGRGYKVYNTQDYAEFVYGGTRMHKLIGWRSIGEILKSNIKGAAYYADRKLKKWLKEKWRAGK